MVRKAEESTLVCAAFQRRLGSQPFPPNEGTRRSRASSRCVCGGQCSRVVDDFWVSWGLTQNIFAALHPGAVGAPRPSARRGDAREVEMRACDPTLPAGRSGPSPFAAGRPPRFPSHQAGRPGVIADSLLLPSGVQHGAPQSRPPRGSAASCLLPPAAGSAGPATGSEKLLSGPSRGARTARARTRTVAASRTPRRPPAADSETGPSLSLAPACFSVSIL